MCEDSRTYATALARVLQFDGDIAVVATYETAEELLAALPALKVDLVTMDLELPGVDGIAATRQIMAQRPLPVVVVSTRAGAQSAEALSAGAVDVLHKGDLALREADSPEGDALRQRIRRLSRIRVFPRGTAAPPSPGTVPPEIAAHAVRAIGIASSTGGPSALRAVLGHLPPELEVPVLVVQHMTNGFTEGLVRWLDHTVPPAVRLAADGQRATPGVWMAPDGAHLSVDRRLVLRLDANPRGYAHRPAADVLFLALADALRSAVAVAVLTGMGSDGARGVEAVVAAGGVAIAQDEASSAVAGMPRAAAAAGARLVMPLEKIGPALAGLPVRSSARGGKGAREPREEHA